MPRPVKNRVASCLNIRSAFGFKCFGLKVLRAIKLHLLLVLRFGFVLPVEDDHINTCNLLITCKFWNEGILPLGLFALAASARPTAVSRSFPDSEEYEDPVLQTLCGLQYSWAHGMNVCQLLGAVREI